MTNEKLFQNIMLTVTGLEEGVTIEDWARGVKTSIEQENLKLPKDELNEMLVLVRSIVPEEFL